MKRIKTTNKGRVFFILFCSCYLLVLSFFSGCGNKFFDPTQIGRFRPTPAVNVILDSLGVAEEEPPVWEGAEEPRPEDAEAELAESDYTFKSGDVVRISIYELYREAAVAFPFDNDYVVTETGKISIPDVGVVQAAGLTENQLEEQIRQILSPSILKEPAVKVTLVGSQQRVFTVLGDGVPIPGRYAIPRYDFRLTDALAVAGGPRQFNVSYIYVFRRAEERNGTLDPPELEVIEPEMELTLPEMELTLPEMVQPESNENEAEKPEELEELVEPERELLEVITPLAKHHWPKSNVVIASTELVTDRELTEWPEITEPARQRVVQPPKVPQRPEPSLELVGPEKTEEPVSIQDILKTLAERARQEKVKVVEKAEIEDTIKSFAEPAVPEPLEQPIDVEEAIKSFAEPTPEKVTEEPVEAEEEIEAFEPAVETEPVIPQIAPEVPVREAELEPGRIEWIFKDGKWVPVQIGPPTPPRPREPIIEVPEPVVVPRELMPPGFEMVEKPKTRVIKIPVNKLLTGNPRYNIMIKPGDSVHVPRDVVGEFCIMGNVNYQGYIDMTGRPMTLKMAIAAAGGLGPLAWPKTAEVVRRISEDKEEIVMVDLDKIASGEQPDFFIKPNDLINIGTHATSRWRAVLRNAFRATYGFGFVYDRNFADRDYGNRPLPRWF